MKKEKTKIAVNVSSGAEKVERVEKEIKKESDRENAVEKSKKMTMKNPRQEESAQGESALGGDKIDGGMPTIERKRGRINAKKMNAETSGGKAEMESKMAKARVEKAILRKKEQEKRKEKRAKKAKVRKEMRRQKLVERKQRLAKEIEEERARLEKLMEERKALSEKRKHQREEAQRERAHAKANKKQGNARKKKQKSSNGERKHDGYGGWLAAVLSLGAVTLALGTVVTVGAIDMNRTKKGVLGSHRATMYEFTEVLEHVDDDLERVRISATPTQQSRILTDLLVQSRLAEMDLERLPICAEDDCNTTKFLNQTARECERLLGKLAQGETLTERDIAKLESLYEKSHSICQEMESLTLNMDDKTLSQYIKDGMGKMGESLKKLEELTLMENRAVFDEMVGAGTSSMEKPAQKESPDAIDGAKASALAKKYFSDYKIEEFQCIGETNARGHKGYRVQGYDEKGKVLLAEIRAKDGALVRFDYDEECVSETFDLQNAERIAKSFVEKLGYENLEIIRKRENGVTTDFTMVYTEGDVACYADEVHVKVCRTRGVVSGFDASRFLDFHHARKEVQPKLTLAQAHEKLSKKLTMESARVALVHTARGERPAYEFLCSYNDEMYFVYIDGDTGMEISIMNAKDVQTMR